MKNWIFLFPGILFGIIMTKSEAISWYRIQEMFRFESFHMYGIIGTAVILGAIVVFLIKKLGLKTVDGTEMNLKPKDKRYKAALFGGTIFGFGWAMTGACPGPMYVLVGNGLLVFGVVILSAALGALTYGAIGHKLPQ
jgi:uncharacterized membrane protein YedE/YeeE